MEKKWWRPIFEHINQITLANIYIIHKRFQEKPLRRTDFHLKIIRYLCYKEKVESPLKMEHYPDWVPAKKEMLDQGNDQVGGRKKDFRLRCRRNGCSKKTDLCCPGCSKANVICALCVPECFNTICVKKKIYWKNLWKKFFDSLIPSKFFFEKKIHCQTLDLHGVETKCPRKWTV